MWVCVSVNDIYEDSEYSFLVLISAKDIVQQ